MVIANLLVTFEHKLPLEIVDIAEYIVQQWIDIWLKNVNAKFRGQERTDSKVTSNW